MPQQLQTQIWTEVVFYGKIQELNIEQDWLKKDKIHCVYTWEHKVITPLYPNDLHLIVMVIWILQGRIW